MNLVSFGELPEAILSCLPSVLKGFQGIMLRSQRKLIHSTWKENYVVHAVLEHHNVSNPRQVQKSLPHSFYLCAESGLELLKND